MRAGDSTGSQSYSSARTAYKLGTDEVVAAVESLYEDKVQPLGRILLKRVGERVAAARRSEARGPSSEEADLVPRIHPQHLRKVCERCPRLIVEDDQRGEYVALLRCVASRSAFVDPNSENDPYPAKLWQELASFLEGLEGDAIFWPSGRFACAQALVDRGPPCLAYRSLGEVVHIVQLGISQKKIMGYRDGQLVPYRHSRLLEKEQCASVQQPSMRPTLSMLPVATWEDVSRGLATLLQRSEGGGIQLPNVKRLFRSELGLELSETALGHARVFELLHDSRLGELCELHLEGKNWLVRHRSPVQPTGSCEVPRSGQPSRDFQCLSTTPMTSHEGPSFPSLPAPWTAGSWFCDASSDPPLSPLSPDAAAYLQYMRPDAPVSPLSPDAAIYVPCAGSEQQLSPDAKVFVPSGGCDQVSPDSEIYEPWQGFEQQIIMQECCEVYQGELPACVYAVALQEGCEGYCAEEEEADLETTSTLDAPICGHSIGVASASVSSSDCNAADLVLDKSLMPTDGADVPDPGLNPIIKNTFIHLKSSPSTRQRSRSVSLPPRC